MKEFNLEQAKEGKPVCTKRGEPVRIICFDAVGECPIIGLVKGEQGNELPFVWKKDGDFMGNPEDDLMMQEEFIYINGHKVPEPENAELELYIDYFIPSLDSYESYRGFSWENRPLENRWLKKGLVHLTKEAAIKHAKALLSHTDKTI